MEEVLYELHYQFPIFLIPCILFLALTFCYIYMKYRKACKSEDEEGTVNIGNNTMTIKTAKRFMVGYGIAVTVICGLIFYLNWETYYFLKENYKSGNYEEVCGYVEEFKAGLKWGRGYEARDYFAIDDVEFEINPGGPVAGYIKIRDAGGVIEGDGQYLHIKYVDRQIGNVIERRIVYIAEIEEEGN